MQLVDKLMSPDTGFATVKAGDEATLLVNNMGSTPPSELYLVARSALDYLTTVKQVCSINRFVRGGMSGKSILASCILRTSFQQASLVHDE